MFFVCTHFVCCTHSPPLNPIYFSVDTHFFRGTTRLMSWQAKVRYSSLLVFLLLPLIYTFSFLRRRHTVSSKVFNTQVPSVSIEKLMLLRLSCCVLLSLLQWIHTAFCQHSLESAKSKILHATPAIIRQRTLLILFCTVQQRTLCAASFLVILCLSMTFGPGSG